MIKDDIKNYNKQFEYEPEIQNAGKLGKYSSYVIGGMGGSGLVAGILRAIKPSLDVAAHHEYGLPSFADKNDKKKLFIAISHSGNTEETIDFCETAIKNEIEIAVIASGGKLLEIAKENNIPYIDLPGDDVQPRMTLGYMLRAILKLIGEEELYEEAGKLSELLEPEKFESAGEELGEKLFGNIPVIYASRDNQTLAYNWKIKFNETGKIPAFYNTFPELNHNEMNSFDVIDSTKALSDKFRFVFLEDDSDNARIKIRMDTTAKLYDKRGFGVELVKITGGSKLEKIFNALILGDWTAIYLSEKYGTEPEQVPMVEEFKKLIK